MVTLARSVAAFVASIKDKSALIFKRTKRRLIIEDYEHFLA